MVTARTINITLASLSLTFAMFATTQRFSMAEPIGWMERYALATDREAMLDELIPGSDDYFFHHCLHYQTTGQLQRSETILRDWLAEHKGRETPAITAMLDRQRLLTYSDSPQRTIDHLVRRLGIKLNHAPPATHNERRFPSELDPSPLSIDALVKDALRRNSELKPRGVQYLAEQFRHGKDAGISINLRELLGRVSGPYVDGLADLVVQELKGRRPNERSFGDLLAHKYLTLDELRKVASQIENVAADNRFVTETLSRLHPDSDSDPSQQQQVRIDYLTRVEAYVRTLPPSYNSMKASAIYRLLEANLARGVFDRELFMRYLELPRVSPIVRQEWARRSGTRAQLNEDFMEVALLPPVGDEEPLVRTHLERFLRDAVNVDAFSQYLQPDYLRRVFAETKLLFGVGDEQRWYKMLSASQRQAVRDAVELRLAADNPKRLDADESAQLRVEIKNVQELVVRIYEINTQSYYRTHDEPIDTDIDLDGLVATHERKLTFNQPAVERHREVIELPEAADRGVWIVDLVGKGVRARALVRRGAINHVDSSDANGMVFTIIDENRKPIPTATMWVGSRQFVADDDGRIVLPPVVDRVTRRAIISDGVIAEKIKFEHLREKYQLQAGMHLDRTQLQSGGETELMIRPRLTMGDTIIDPATLSDVSVRVEATDLEDLSTTHQVNDLKLDQHGELLIPIRIPSRLARLSATLEGKLGGLADRKVQTLQASHEWDVAGIRKTGITQDVFLTSDEKGFVIEVRGRNGELIPRETVRVKLTTDARVATLEQTLQSDDRGRVRLGKLDGVTQIQYSLPSGPHHHRDLQLNQTRWPGEIHTTTDREIRLALSSSQIDVRARYRLLDVRGGNYHAAHADHLSAVDGLLTVQALPPGDYHLIDRTTGAKTLIAVVDGPAIGLVAAGQTRHRLTSPAEPVGIASVSRDQNGLKIKLSGTTDSSRVHLYASRYFDQATPIGQLGLGMPRLTGRRVRLPICGYVSDLRLGDEYQYVLRRRYVNKYPGVMLPQPGILLNPWETEETSNESQMVRDGEAPPPSAMAAESPMAAVRQAEAAPHDQAGSSDFDFLADSGCVVGNLRPDDDGVVTIDADLIEGLPILQIVVANPATLLQRTVTAPIGDVETVDLRLAKSLDAAVPFSFERGITVASPEKPIDLKSLGSAQLQVYASVRSLFTLYKTLVNDSRLSDFDELADWHTLDRNGKLAAYARLASHELHLFLAFHDQPFFDDVIKPYLANKKEKQFVDHWLLGEDLSMYMALWRYNQLNAAERALLAMKLPEARQTAGREMREIVASQEENHVAVRRSIESALMTWSAQPADVDFDDMGLELREEEMDAFSFDGAALFGDQPARESRAKSARQRKSRALSISGNAARGLQRSFGGRSGGMGGGAAFFRDLDSTKQWAESHWDRVRTVGGPLPASLISANAFWADLANAELEKIEVSNNLLRPIENRHAALVALALCGLPLKAGEVGLPTQPETEYKPAHAVAVVTKRLKRLEDAEGETSILIGQRFESLEQTTRKQSSSREVLEPREFLTGVAYRGHVVVSNPTAQQRLVDVFWQLPSGSLPLSGCQTTDSRTLTLKPFAVEAIEYQFYFPAAGDFQHYPSTVAIEGKLIAQSAEKRFEVVAEPSKESALTWESVAKTGTAEEIDAFLDEANLHEIDWMLVIHRMQDEDVYRVVIDALDHAKLPHAELWAYAFKHRDEKAMRTYLSVRSDLISLVGPSLRSSLLDVEPVQRRIHELLEYAPLVRARIHRLGEQNEILNPTFRAQYQSFVRSLGFSREINAEDNLVLAYYLLIQNRIAEAIEAFDRVDRAEVPSQLQYDYLGAYLALHREQYDEAEAVARRYADYPIPRWQSRFSQLLSQLGQRRSLNQVEKLVSVERQDGSEPIPEGSGDLSVIDRERRQASASDQQPEVIVRVEGNSLRIDHRRAKEVQLRFYGVDLEHLFSKAPFVREDLQRMAMVRPMRTEQIRFDESTGVGRFDLNENLRRQTLLVEVVAGAARSTALYYGGDITTYVSESFGQLQTTDSNSHRPISTAYVKVYAKYPDGDVRFYKDGYTDSRGRFDYASLSAGDAKGAMRFAILVISEEKGATLHDVAAPNQ